MRWQKIGFSLFCIAAVTPYLLLLPSKIQKRLNRKVIRTKQPMESTDTTDRGVRHQTQYVPTSFGRTYTERWSTNRKEGHHMLLIHGFSMANSMTIAFAPFIVDNLRKNKLQNVRSVTAIHLYGRGLSDCPLYPHSRSLFLSQITDIMTSLQLDGALILCGMSMGGGIVAEFANLYPHRIHKLVMFAPAGFTMEPPRKWKVLSMPWIGNLMLFFGASRLRKVMESNISESMKVDQFGDAAKRAIALHVEKLKNMDQHEGYLWALLSTLRHFEWGMKSVFDELYARSDFDNSRWRIVWGTLDGTCPIKPDDMFPDIKTIKIQGAGHGDIVQDYCIKQYGDKMVRWFGS